jgi:hypothetical protein
MSAKSAVIDDLSREPPLSAIGSRWQLFTDRVMGGISDIHLRTKDLTRPWQSYRHTFRADSQWRTVQCRFQDFVPYRTDTPLDTRRLRRIGVVAIGRAFSADLSVGGLRYLA